MTVSQTSGALARPTFAELFTPKIVTVLGEGYGWRDLRLDALAGLSVAIVALPLSMAIAVASGATPAQGLVTAIVGGFLVSAFSGSRFQIGGPAGAFIVLVATTVALHGMDGLILAVFLSGFMLAALGLLRLGTFIKFIPYPVTVGFTAGIAVIILASQIKDLFGLTLGGSEPGPLLDKIPALLAAAPTVAPSAVAVSLGTIAVIVALKHLRPHWPGILVAVAAAAGAAAVFGLPVDTIGSRFGELPHGLPAPSLPDLSPERVWEMLPAAGAFTLLGAIESLLSAVVADGMTGRRHRSNCELVAQGVANMGTALFGGICVTGTIARTATNVRSGARGPLSGMLHSLFLLLIMAVAAPLIALVPLAALAGVLAVVAWNMLEKRAFARLVRASWGDALVLLVTFGLTVFRDLTEGIVVGFALSALQFIHRMSQSAAVEIGVPAIQPDRADRVGDPRTPYDETLASDPDIVVYRISGAFFFGAAATIGMVLDRIADTHRALIVDFSAVPVMDSTGAHTVEALVDQARRKGVAVFLTGLSKPVRAVLANQAVAPPAVHIESTIQVAQAKARQGLQPIPPGPA